jgi:hypothetical protein
MCGGTILFTGAIGDEHNSIGGDNERGAGAERFGDSEGVKGGCMQLTIIQEDHDKAMREYDARDTLCHICPVAQALMRLGHTHVAVGSYHAKSNQNYWILPTPTTDFITNWPKVVPKFPMTLTLEEE